MVKKTEGRSPMPMADVAIILKSCAMFQGLPTERTDALMLYGNLRMFLNGDFSLMYPHIPLYAVGPQGERHFPHFFFLEELANLLCTNRSTLSHELSLMAQDGLIQFHKNPFTFLPEGLRQSKWIILS